MPPIPIYVINLDRSSDRLEKITRSAQKHGVEFIRTVGVDGATVAEADRIDFGDTLFKLRCGRKALPGEYGCYRSHLLALEAVANGERPTCLIMEDDVDFADNMMSSMLKFTELMPRRSILKLVHHRAGGFVKLHQLSEGVEIGVCWMGPQGSTAGYLVTRDAARVLLRRLKSMSLPVDVAMERSWSTLVPVLSIRSNFLPFMDGHRGETLVATTADYRSVKFSRLQRIPSYMFKAKENVMRLGYAITLVALHRLRGRGAGTKSGA